MILFDRGITTEVDLLANKRYDLGAYLWDPATSTGYRYWHNAGADATIVGDAAAHKGTYGQVSVTSGDGVINAVSTVAWCAGIAQAVIASGYCGWFQTKGPGQVAAVTDTGIAAGDPLVIDSGATPVGILDTMADGEEEGVLGYALAADSGSSQAANTYILTID